MPSTHLKPYWNSELTQLARTKQAAWHMWVQSGRHRGKHPDFLKLKEVKKLFRKKQKESEKLWEQSRMEEINLSGEIDQKHFWLLVNRSKKKSGLLHPIKTADGKIITDPLEQVREWRTYLEKLYTPINDDKYDSGFKQAVERELEEMVIQSYFNEDNILKDKFSSNEVMNVCKLLKRNKAPGWDQITTEHVKFGGEMLLHCLRRLFNAIVLYEYVPLYFKRGIIVTLPKGDKNTLYQDNYRGITLITVFAKLFEKCTMYRIEDWNKEAKVIDILQGALIEKCSSLHTAWMVKETVCCNREEGKSVYVGLLDIKKAYDTVWQDGLFYKLYKAGINGKTWRILRQLYKGFKCKVRVAGILSEEFEALQGIHQGAPCSYFKHALYGNDLIMYIKESIVGAKMCKQVTSCPSFADDIAVIALSKEGLQMLIDIAYRYSRKWRFQFSPTKCKVVIFGSDSNPRLKVKMGSSELEISNCEKHLGVALANSDKHEETFIEGRIKSCKSILYGIKAIGSKRVPVTPVISSKLYNSVCIPKLLYGVEVMNVSEGSLDKVTTFHCHAAKNLQGLPDQAVNCGSLATIGWPSISCIIDKLRLLFLCRLLALPMTNIYKVLIIRRIISIVYNPGTAHVGPTSTMLKLCNKYGILTIVLDCINTGCYLSMAEWKRLVTKAVICHDTKKWKVTCALHKSLYMLNTKVQEVLISPWWLHCYRNINELHNVRCVIQLLLGKYRQREICCLCLNGHFTVHHMLF